MTSQRRTSNRHVLGKPSVVAYVLTRMRCQMDVLEPKTGSNATSTTETQNPKRTRSANISLPKKRSAKAWGASRTKHMAAIMARLETSMAQSMLTTQKAPGKSKAIACLDGSKKSCGKKKCIEKGVFKKSSFKDGCEPSGGILKTVTVNTWFLPEKISWKILKQKGRKTVCKSKPYDKWYSKIEEDVSRCRLTPGVAYILQCRDKYGSGWAGGSIVIQGVTYCGDGYKFQGGYKKERVFVVKGKRSSRRRRRRKKKNIRRR